MMNTISVAVLAVCLVTGPVAVAGAQGAKGPVYKPGNGVSAPVVVKQVKPQYTAEAMRAKIEGSVGLECVVETDGRVDEVTVTKSLDEGLDQEAIKSVRQWRFEPGKKDGKAVRVQITLEMTFTLK
jgi:protein TonB